MGSKKSHKDTGKRKKKKKKMPRKSDEIKIEPQKKDSEYRFVLRPPVMTLEEAYIQLRKAGKLGVRDRKEGEGQYAPLALHIEREKCGGQRNSNYTVFLKHGTFEQRQVYHFGLYNTDKGYVLRERCLDWTSKSGFEDKELDIIYYKNGKIGGKERRKERIRSRKEARGILFKKVLETATRILENHCGERILPLVWQEYPERDRRVYEDAKQVLWNLGRIVKGR